MAVSVHLDAWGRPESPPANSRSNGKCFGREEEKKKTTGFVDRCRDNKSPILQFCSVSAAIFVIYMFFSDGDFSFLLTMASVLSFFSFGKVAWVIWSKGSVAGVSCRMMECYVVAFFSRLVSILWMDGYLPYDRSGDYIYRFSEIGCFVVSCATVYACRKKFAPSYDFVNDTLPSLYLIGGCVVLGLLFHPHLNGFMLCDVAWSQGLYLEAVASLPQLVLFRSQKKVESFTTNFLMTQIVVRIFSFIFWASSSRDLHSYHLEGSIRAYASSMVVVMHLLQLLIMVDFVWQYFKCWRKGVPLQYMMADLV